MSSLVALRRCRQSILLVPCLVLSIAACGTRRVETASPPTPPAVESPAAPPVRATTPAPGAAAAIVIADVGLQTPESVLYDAAADLYLVSNINGGPSAKANNGFISRISPEGEVRQLRWVEGGRDGVVLHAPKGMAIGGDSLFVADIDTVRIFHRTTGARVGALAVPGSTFLNDLAVGPDGTLYVTDTGVRIGAAGIEPTGTDAVYRFGVGGTPEAIARGEALQRPNGIVVDAAGVIMVPFGSNEVIRIAPDGTRSTIARLPAGQLDGVVRLGDGTLLVSSWEGQAVYRVDSAGQVTTAVTNVEAPADIGYDTRRGRLLIPLFMANRVEVRPL
jgi:sugar lactone lactonase YvrE